MHRHRRSWGAWTIVAVLVLAPHHGWADAIDGHWCFTDGSRMSIQGPSIVTPAGSHIQGDYARHYFSYVVPPADPDAGATVAMTLINEDTVHLRLGRVASSASEGPMQVWHRCGPPTS